MKKMKRILASALSVILILSTCCLSPVFAAEAEENPDISLLASWDIPATAYITAANGNTVRITMTLTVRDEMANQTGGYITNVKNVKAYNDSGWVYVSPTATISQPEYTHNHQEVSFTVFYQASIGEGLTNYSGTVTIHLKDL